MVHLPATQVGAGLTIAGLTGLTAGLPAGNLADRYGPHTVRPVALALQTVTMAAFVPALGQAGWLLLAAFFAALGAAGPPVAAWAERAAGSARAGRPAAAVAVADGRHGDAPLQDADH